MKGKKQLIVLLVLVAGIWGFILVKIISQLNGGSDFRPGPRLTSHEEPHGRDSIDFVLLLDYPDPFNGQRKKENPSQPVRIRVPPKPVVKRELLPDKTLLASYQFRFYGIVESPSKERKGLLSAKGKFHHIALNDKVDDWTVFFINPDSVGLRIDDQKRIFIRRK